jgi:hypothetical protein
VPALRGRLLGELGNPADWETWTTPTIIVDRP